MLSVSLFVIQGGITQSWSLQASERSSRNALGEVAANGMVIPQGPQPLTYGENGSRKWKEISIY